MTSSIADHMGREARVRYIDHRRLERVRRVRLIRTFDAPATHYSGREAPVPSVEAEDLESVGMGNGYGGLTLLNFAVEDVVEFTLAERPGA